MKNLLLLLGLILLLPLVGCELRTMEDTVDIQQKLQTEQILKEASKQVGLPNIVNFQQKKLMKLIYELCDKENLVCFAYIKSDYQGKLIFIGKCIGYGIPFSAQYTNPNKIAESYSQGGFAILPQADPNGLFMPQSSSATWLMMIEPETGKPRPVYIEPEIVVSPFKLHNDR